MAGKSSSDLIDQLAAGEMGKAFSVLVDNLVQGDGAAETRFSRAVAVINQAKGIAANVLGGSSATRATRALASSKKTRTR
jgi:hypothetical protein